jgi:hypothetical protein
MEYTYQYIQVYKEYIMNFINNYEINPNNKINSINELDFSKFEYLH